MYCQFNSAQKKSAVFIKPKHDQIQNMHDVSNSRAEHQCGLCFYTLFCSDYLIIWGWPQLLKPLGQGNYFHECHIFYESRTFNQAVLMMDYNFGDWTKSSVVVMSCEDFDYGKKWSQHHCILYPWLSCPVWMTSTYFKLMGIGITFFYGFCKP